MNKQYPLALHIFRRDLRLQDNTALITCLEEATQVIPCFIFDKRQIDNNPYKSDHAIQFMVQSLKELDAALKALGSKLYVFHGIAEDIIAELITAYKIKAVFINRDYTPFSTQRDQAIQTFCEKQNVDFRCFADALLHEPEHVLKPNGEPYTVFTHFFNKAKTLTVDTPKKNTYKNYYQLPIKNETYEPFQQNTKCNSQLFVKGGRDEGITLLKNIRNLRNYSDNRNIPAISGTSKLSAHNKFGTVSIRELYQAIMQAFDSNHTLINELHWRDFFTHIAFHFPNVFQQAFQQKFRHIQWENNDAFFKAWCQGKTGFPIVDAGMRELNTTGYMHNRVRMITASFLCKDLHIDWRKGEKYFANQLVDYDPAVNNGNWQWSSSTGCDAQPFFRIFNPWLQQEKFDSNCIYIKKWVPELQSYDAKIIHTLYKNNVNIPNYPQPLVNHAVESQKSKIIYSVHLS